ncbi:hypothetical protein B0H11DRAFT_1153787 [Mycena galericulata]|nr:hypothetical protein B0H11DRAFT_1153787 [Mycena galericulata]
MFSKILFAAAAPGINCAPPFLGREVKLKNPGPVMRPPEWRGSQRPRERQHHKFRHPDSPNFRRWKFAPEIWVQQVAGRQMVYSAVERLVAHIWSNCGGASGERDICGDKAGPGDSMPILVPGRRDKELRLYHGSTRDMR